MTRVPAAAGCDRHRRLPTVLALHAPRPISGNALTNSETSGTANADSERLSIVTTLQMPTPINRHDTADAECTAGGCICAASAARLLLRRHRQCPVDDRYDGTDSAKSTTATMAPTVPSRRLIQWYRQCQVDDYDDGTGITKSTIGTLALSVPI